MSDVGQSTGTPPRDFRRRDQRAVAASCAAISAALLGVGQLLFAQWTGLLAWRGMGHESLAATVNEASLIIWLPAAAVAIGAAIPGLVLQINVGRRKRYGLPAIAACGAFLAVPVSTAIAAWAKMYGGGISQLRAMVLVCIGLALGTVFAIATVKSRAMTWSIVLWQVCGWLLLLLAFRGMTRPPVLGHLDPGEAWAADDRVLQARVLLCVIAFVAGVGLGVASVFYGWGARQVRGRLLPPAVPLPLLASASGPGLMFLAYVLACLIEQTFFFGNAASLASATLVAAAGAYVGAEIGRRTMPACKNAAK